MNNYILKMFHSNIDCLFFQKYLDSVESENFPQ